MRASALTCSITLLALLIPLPLSAADIPETAKAEFFEKRVRPILLDHCIRCHGPETTKGGLRLDTKEGWQRGGDSGAAVVPGSPDKSLLIQAIRHTGDLKMPPKKPLSPTDIAALVQWVQDGAIDPRANGPARIGVVSIEDAKKWWSFQPIQSPPLPQSDHKHPIDAFIATKLADKSLSLSPPADRRTLIRRATYDLTGLPPTHAEVEAFLQDRAPDAFAKVVDRLLASPQYGERWGRHWLDLVRYADTAGDNSDHPLPHAWRYRNWVIDAFNRDLPYDQFLREQIAGDLLASQGPAELYGSRIVATGFLAMARRFEHDSDKAMHLTHEDGIDTIGKALLGLTIGCARCHDHKYDAITARDYYALYGILDSSRFSFAGCEAKQQPRDLVPLTTPDEWKRVVEPHQAVMRELESKIRTNIDSQMNHAKRLQTKINSARKPLSIGEIHDGGEQSLPMAETEVRAGELIFLSITPLKNHGADTTQVELSIEELGGQQRKWGTDDLLDQFLAGNPHADRHGNAQTWWLFDTRNQPLPLPEAVRDVSGKVGLHAWRNGDTPSALVNSTNTSITTWTGLSARSFFLHPSTNGNVALAWLSPISGKIKITGRIKDAHPTGPDGVGWVLEHFAVDGREDLQAIAKATSERPELERQKAERLRDAPRQDVAFAVVEGKVADARLHIKGDPEKLGDVVPRRWLEVLGGQPIQTPNQSSGRLDLAGWIASPANPLTARVMANRIWLHHFGKGIVPTPNDFGTRGQPPTHPQLLDWLAADFIASGWSIKAMHRRIMLSATYQQSSMSRADALAKDANNQLYWRFDRRRLAAEELRDSLLSVADNLNRTSARAHPFPTEATWSYTQHVPFSTFFETDRRSVYMISIRNRRHPFLGLFDGADPNATTPQRQSTTVPTQALYFLNDPFFHSQAERLVNRIADEPESQRLRKLFHHALQREPSPRDEAFTAEFLPRYAMTITDRPMLDRSKLAWVALARIILASNEFLFVE